MEKLSTSDTFADFKQITSANATGIGAAFTKEIDSLVELMNCLNNRAFQHTWLLDSPIHYPKNTDTLLYTAFYKNMLLYFSAFDLTLRGLPGPARTLMRNIFEFLVIAKYCSVSHTDDVLKNWEDGKYVPISSNVFKKIQSPDTKNLKVFWDDLNKYAHATIYSQQNTFKWSDCKNDIMLNFGFLRILLECSYHLLNVHLIDNSWRYYAERYAGKEKVRETSKRLRNALSSSREILGVDGRKLAFDFRRKWIVK